MWKTWMMIFYYELCFVCLHVEVWAIKVMKFVFCFVCQYWCRQKFSIIVFACFRQHRHYWFWIAFVPWVKTIDLFNFYDHIGNFQLSTFQIWCNFSLYTAIIYISCSLFRSFQNHDNNIPRPMLSILLGHYFLMNIRFSSRRFIVRPFLSAQQKRILQSWASADHMITGDNSTSRGWMRLLMVPIWHCQPFKSNVFSFSERHAIPSFSTIEIQK